MDVERIDIAEFRAAGYLQELNRRFLHPLGLALEVVVDEDGTERLGGVWDYRDDPEGIAYGGDLVVDAEKAQRVSDLWAERRGPRRERLGFMVQPAGILEDMHVLERTHVDWSLQHPFDCRPDLLACRVHALVARDGDAALLPSKPGRYVVVIVDDEPHYVEAT